MSTATIDSNITGLRYAEEETLKVLPASPVWYQADPNGYDDFGGETKLIARNPINPSRQRKKGVITDLDAKGGFGQDWTQTNSMRLMQGFFFASLREKTTNLPMNDSALDVAAVGTLTAVTIANNDTVTLGAKTYTFKTALTPTANEVLIGGSVSDSLDNLIAAITAGAGSGTLYAAGTTINLQATAAAGAGDTVVATALIAGVAGNSIASTASLTSGSWGASTLTGGADNNTATITAVNGGTKTISIDSTGASYLASDLVKASGFLEAANNGLKTVASSTASTVVVAETMATETTPATAKIQKVGYQFAASVATIDVSGSYPKLVRASGAKDFTTFGLIPGEWVYIGGDSVASAFAVAANNGFARVKSVAATYIEFDETFATMATDAGTGKTIQLFYGNVLKNESDPDLIIRRSYNLERTIGEDDDGTMSEYLVGAVANELAIQIKQADKLMVNCNFMACDHEQRDGATGVKAGSRPTLETSDAFNTSSDFTHIKMFSVVEGQANVTPLFAYLTDMTVNIKNGVNPLKAVGTLGAFEMSSGTFEVGGQVTAYFADVAAASAVRNNEDVALVMALAKNNAGFVLDTPLLALGDGRLKVEQDKPITIPLKTDAAECAAGYTLLLNEFPYLPSVAQ